jgi:arylsulfatase A-like enzyme
MKVGTRTVACLEWPAQIKQPLRTDMVCGQWDMYPTILDIVGVKMPKQAPLDGMSLVPLLKGEMKARPQPVGFMLRRRERDGKATPGGEKRAKGGNLRQVDFIADTQGVWIDGKYKLVVTPTDDPAAPQLKLVDIYADPAEKTNLAAEQPDVVKKMRDALNAWRTGVRASFDGKDF